MNDERTNALTDMAYYSGARYALTALGSGMSSKDLAAELEARVAPARRWLYENRHSASDRQTETDGECKACGGKGCKHCDARETPVKSDDPYEIIRARREAETDAERKASPEHQAQMQWARGVVSNVVIPPADKEATVKQDPAWCPYCGIGNGNHRQGCPRSTSDRGVAK